MAKAYALNQRDRDLMGRTIKKVNGLGKGWAPRPKRRRVVEGSGGGSTANNVAYAIVTSEAGAATHGSGGITLGTTGECELLEIDGSASGDPVLEFKSRHRVPCPVGAIIVLDSPHAIEPGTDWPAVPDSPEEGEAAVWGRLIEPTDYQWELTGAGEKKALAIPEGGTGPTDIQWLGVECEEEEE